MITVLTFNEFAEKYPSFVILPSSFMVDGHIEQIASHIRLQLSRYHFSYKEGYADYSTNVKDEDLYRGVPITLIPCTDEDYKEVKAFCIHLNWCDHFLFVHNSVVQRVSTVQGKSKIIDENFNPDNISEYMKSLQFYYFSFNGILENKIRLHGSYSGHNDCLQCGRARDLLNICAMKNINYTWALQNEESVYSFLAYKEYYKYPL